MFDRLRSFLKQATSALIVSGYSFRDEHLNEVIVQGLQRSPTAICFALLYGALDDYPHAIELAKKRPNLSLLASDAAVISGVRNFWTERQEEADRPDPGKWLKWQPKDPAKPKEACRLQLQLGDFAAFGEFLRAIAGPQSNRQVEKPNGQ